MLVLSKMKGLLCLKDDGTIPLFRLFTIVGICFLTGILIGSLINLNFALVWPIFAFSSLTLLFLLFLYSISKAYSLTVLTAGLLSVIFGLIYFSYFDFKNQENLPFGKVISLSGEIKSKPEITQKQKVIVQGMYDNKKIRVLAYLPIFPEYKYGDIIEISGKVNQPGIIEDFNYGDYLKKYLVYGVIFQPENVHLLKSDSWPSTKIVRVLYLISESLEKSLNRSITEPQSSLASGLILGIKRNIPEQIMDNFKKTGVTHIIALSGYNVTIIISILAILLTPLIGRKFTFYAGSVLVILFVVLTGAMASVVRAAIFSLLLIFGRTIGRQADQANIMILAAILMILFNPFVLYFDVGFQLSFLAFIGIVYLAPFIKKYLLGLRSIKPLKSASAILSETVSAQIMVLPLLIIRFGQLSLISPVANILILLVIPLSMALSFLTGICGLINQNLGIAAGYLLWVPLEYILKLTEFLAKLPMSSININSI